MNGNNTQSKEGFIKALGHPRKVQLAELLFAEDVSVEKIAEAGFNRISALEMAREIKRNVEGMEGFSFDWPRNTDVEVAKPDSTPSEGADAAQTADTANASEGAGQTGEGEGAANAGDDTTVNDDGSSSSAPVEDQTSNSAPAADQTSNSAPAGAQG